MECDEHIDNDKQCKQQIHNDAIELLHPDLLTMEGLHNALCSKGLVIEAGCSRATLIELFHEHVLPKPQREYRNNRHGRKLTAMQNSFNRKRTITYTESQSSNKRMKNDEPIQKKQGLVNDPTAAIEKPKTNKGGTVNFERHLIKLSGRVNAMEVATKPKVQSIHVSGKSDQIHVSLQPKSQRQKITWP